MRKLSATQYKILELAASEDGVFAEGHGWRTINALFALGLVKPKPGAVFGIWIATDEGERAVAAANRDGGGT